MNSLFQPCINSIESTKTRTVSESDKPDVLTDIYKEYHNIVIWRRSLETRLLSVVQQLLDSNQSIQIDQVVSSHNVVTVMQESLQNFGSTDALISDIEELVGMFCVLFELKRVGLRLTAIDQAMCPRFHVDKVPCRLVTTYQGICTQWLPHHAVDRTKLGTGNNGLPDDLSGLYQSERDIQQLDRGHVALFKGELWEGNENAGLVHRSPTPEPGEKRLLLTLDFQ